MRFGNGFLVGFFVGGIVGILIHGFTTGTLVL
jgi:hypothetical protein